MKSLGARLLLPRDQSFNNLMVATHPRAVTNDPEDA